MNKLSINRRQMLYGGAALGAASLTRFGPAESATKVLKVQSKNRFTTLDPAQKLYGDEDAAIAAITPMLITFREKDWGWDLEDATYLEQVDDLHVKFTLRPGMGWTNGFGEVTAEDVKFSYERIVDPEVESPYAVDFEGLERVDVIDKLTGVMVFSKPNVPLFGNALPVATGAIVCKKAVEGLAEKTYGMNPPAEAGPYLVDRWVQGTALYLKPNPDWTGKKPAFDEIQYMEIDDEQTAVIAYETGEIDAVRVPIREMARFAVEPLPDTTLVRRPALAYWWIGMMTDNPPFDDIRVRQAVTYAIDVDEILEGAFFGLSERATGIICPGVVGWRETNLLPQQPNLDKARELLAEAGLAGGFKTVISAINRTENVTVAQIASAHLAKVGIEAEVEPIESGSFWDRFMGEEGEPWKKQQIHVARYGSLPDPSFYTAWFTPEQVGEWNLERWDNAEFGELHLQALSETDEAKRHEQYVRMANMMDESAAYIYLTHGTNAWLVRDNIDLALLADAKTALLRRCRPA